MPPKPPNHTCVVPEACGPQCEKCLSGGVAGEAIQVPVSHCGLSIMLWGHVTSLHIPQCEPKL